MSRRKTFRQSNWLIELSPRKNIEPRIVPRIVIRSTFRFSTFFSLIEKRNPHCLITTHGTDYLHCYRFVFFLFSIFFEWACQDF